ncbi:hypothetical protein F5I97DRAFT_1869601 [Phlebopus sp. FC_14]|nr:hypothetical protein F5I97DRAFT_1869601 [Phlebopus sp. FC_14]
MFNNASNIDASHSTFSEVHRDQYLRSQTQIQGNQTVNTIIHGNQIFQGSSALESLVGASVTSASFDSIDRHPAPTCLPGTRLGLLERLTEWVDDRDSGQRICWLSGLAGSGKSAVAQTVAEKYASQHRLAASFFFSRKEMARRTAQRFFPTITCHLLTFAPSITPAIVDALSDDYTIPTKVLAEQMRRLLLAPLSAVENSHKDPTLIVVDSLDECDNEKMAREVVVLLAELLRDCRWPLKVLLTSRPEAHILRTFRQEDLRALTCPFQLNDFNVEDDIKSYLDHAFEDIRLNVADASSTMSLPDDWPPEADVQAIVQKSSRLFIFATTVVKFVGDKHHNASSRLDTVLRGSIQGASASLYADLDTLYLDALRTYPDADKTRLLLGAVAFVFSPLSTRALNSLLCQFQVDASLTADSLRSVLVVPDAAQDGAIRIYHTSFRDFLTNPQRSRQFFVDAVVYHRILARACLESMIRQLTTDMCKLRDPTILHTQLANLSELCKLHIDAGVQYACRHFAHHLSLVPKDERLNETLVICVQGFARGYLLNWIEALSLLGELDSAVISLRLVANWLKCSSDPHQETLALLYDAERLVLMCSDGIQQAALQTYSVLPFIPGCVQLRKTYQQDLAGQSTVLYGLENYWNACTCSLSTRGTIQSLAVSQGGLIAATGSFPGVKMWDSLTGRNVAHFAGSGKSSCPVCFSPSGVYAAVGCETGAIDVWDVSTGQSLIFNDSSVNDGSAITTIAFTWNSRLIASASAKGIVHIWEVPTGNFKHSFAFHDASIHCLVFSSDDSLLASGSEDMTVVTSDVTTGRLLRKMKGHHAKVNCIAFSKDRKSIASGSDDKTVRVWDTRTGVCIRTSPKGHRKPIMNVCFTPDNEHVISVCNLNVFLWATSRTSVQSIWSLDESLRKATTIAPIWYGKAAKLLTPGLLGRIADSDDGTPMYPALSPDSQTLAFARGAALYFLDSMVPGLNPAPIRSGATGFTAVAVGPGAAQQLVTSNTDGTIQVWRTVANPVDGWRQVQEAMKEVAEYLRPSVDGQRYLIKTLFDLFLVDAEGKIIKELESGDTEMTTAAIPSHDARYFAYWAEDFWTLNSSASIRVYNASTGARFKRFSGLLKIKCVAFSPRSEWLACGYGEGVVQVWELTSGQCTACVKTGQKSITSLVFLPGNAAFVCGSEEGCLTIRSVENGDVLDQLTDITVEITTIAVASDSSFVIAGCKDGSVHAWNPAQAISRRILPPNPDESIDFIAFTNRPNTVSCRSGSGIVTTWDMTRCFARDENQDVHLASEDHEDGPTSPFDYQADLVSRTDASIVHDYFLRSGYSVDTGNGWVYQGGKRVLWLPDEFLPRSPDAFSVVGKNLAIFARSGRVKIIDIEPMVARSDGGLQESPH